MCPAVAFEMLVSHSPPVFSHSPPTSFLSDYPKYHDESSFTTSYYGRNRRNTPSPPPPPLLPQLNYQQKHNTKKLPPIRPCLVIRPEDQITTSPAAATTPPPTTEEDPTSPTKLKKKVVFADDKGMSLTQVRVMTEPSNVPPLWSFRYLAEVTKGIQADAGPLIDTWELTFPQPASDYVEFRKKLDYGKVSLENVIIKEADDLIVGTIKVSNLSFHKEVFIRLSHDNWENFEDAFCKYVPNSMAATINSAYILFDTFSFKIQLPRKLKKIEFCVCFRCDGKEYWDNNNNKNYVILKKIVNCNNNSNNNNNNNDLPPIQKSQDAVNVKLDSWSEFASWSHLENTTPYY